MEQIKPDKVENEMAYIVVYQRANGSSAVESCYDLSSAVEAAERLRNSDSVERPRIFETSEIRYDFQPYYRVKVIDPKTTAALGLAADEMEPAFSFGEVVNVESADARNYDDLPEFDEPPYDEPIFDEPPFEEEAVIAESNPEDADVVDADLESSVPQELEGQGTIDDHVDSLDEPVAGDGVDSERASGIDTAPKEIAPEEIAPEAIGTTADIASSEEVAAPDMGEADSEVIDLRDDTVDVDSAADATSESASALGVDAPDVDPAETVTAEAPAKPGLFEKFVKSLEGNNDSGAAATATSVGTDAVEDLGGSVNPRRGLFGK